MFKMVKNDITNSASSEIVNLTTTARYKQIIDKLTCIINHSFSYIDLTFCKNKKYSRNMELIFPFLANA